MKQSFNFLRASPSIAKTGSTRVAQSAGPGLETFFYQFGFLFESIVTPWGHFWRPCDAAFRSKNRLWRPRCPMTPHHRNLLTLLGPFWEPRNHQKYIERTSQMIKTTSQDKPCSKRPLKVHPKRTTHWGLELCKIGSNHILAQITDSYFLLPKIST